MNQMPPQPLLVAFLPIALLIATLGTWLCSSVYSRYTGLPRSKSALLWLLAFGLAVGFIAYKRNESHYPGNSSPATLFFILCAILLPLLTLPFITRLYRKWIGGHVTEAEKLPGVDGVRAWLGVGNVICAVLIPLCIWGVFIISPLPMLALTFGALLAYPLLNLASSSAQPVPAGPVEDLSGEREKVLQLLEAGKISAADSADLLNALAHSAPPPPQPTTEINPQRKLVLIGATLLLLGFFLPWFNINPGAMLHEATSQLRQSMNQMMPGNALPQMNLSLQTGSVQIRAGDIAHGLGWWILTLGIAAAVLPFFATTLEATLQKRIILAALGIGVILLLYLLFDTFKYVSFGILLALAGYVLEVIGTLKERPAAR